MQLHDWFCGPGVKPAITVWMILNSDGVGRSGTFCALMVSINRFKAEQTVDIFQTIIKMRATRPGMVKNAVSNT